MEGVYFVNTPLDLGLFISFIYVPSKTLSSFLALLTLIEICRLKKVTLGQELCFFRTPLIVFENIDYEMFPGFILVIKPKILASTFKRLGNFTAEIVEEFQISLVYYASRVEENIFLARKGLH